MPKLPFPNILCRMKSSIFSFSCSEVLRMLTSGSGGPADLFDPSKGESQEMPWGSLFPGVGTHGGLVSFLVEHGRPISTGPSRKMCSESRKERACWVLSIIASASAISFWFIPQRLATFVWHRWWTFMPHASHLSPCLASPQSRVPQCSQKVGLL